VRRNRHYRVGEAFDVCAICGMDRPMSELRTSGSRFTLGRLVCVDTCVDNVDVERRDKEIARAISKNSQYEGADTRAFRYRFFGNAEEI
jgi:hypothetical protein